MQHSRSLLAGEALEEHPGVLVDPQVVHGLGIGRGGLSIGPALASNVTDGRKGVTAEGLHDWKRAIEGKREERSGEDQESGKHGG